MEKSEFFKRCPDFGRLCIRENKSFKETWETCQEPSTLLQVIGSIYKGYRYKMIASACCAWPVTNLIDDEALKEYWELKYELPNDFKTPEIALKVVQYKTHCKEAIELLSEIIGKAQERNKHLYTKTPGFASGAKMSLECVRSAIKSLLSNNPYESLQHAYAAKCYEYVAVNDLTGGAYEEDYLIEVNRDASHSLKKEFSRHVLLKFSEIN